jgi:hypothetical protein
MDLTRYDSPKESVLGICVQQGLSTDVEIVYFSVCDGNFSAVPKGSRG